MTMPARFEGAVAAWLSAHAPGGRREAAAVLSAAYRAGQTSHRVDLAAYLVARLPATYAAVAHVLREAAALRPDVPPRSLLDAGCGPGTASWAASEVWPGLAGIQFLDSSPEFLSLAKELARHGSGALAEAASIPGDITAPPPGISADLTVAAYSLAELPLPRIGAAVQGLWAASRKLLALIEPGTPQGFARISAAREALLGQGAIPVAPCTHALACPMAGGDWCHFSVRLPRSRAHMHAKGARVPFEDERFSYLVVARQGPPPRAGRIVSPPSHAKPGVSLRLCEGGRIAPCFIARRDGAAYKQARKLAWGDLFVRHEGEAP